MLKSRILTGALITAAVAVTSLFAAAPASAATLPTGQKISVADWDTFQFSYSSTEAVLTPVGTGVIPSQTEYLEAVDVDNKGIGYALSTSWVTPPPPEPDPDCDVEDPEDPDCVIFPAEDVPDGAYLYTANAGTGSLGSPGKQVMILTGPVEEPSLVAADSCFAIDYTGGKILAACNIYGDGGDSAWIGYIDPATGYLQSSLLLVDEAFLEFTAIAINPIDGVVWAFSYDEAFTLVLTGPQVGATDEFGLDLEIYAADFDNSGQLWASAYFVPGPAERVIEEGEEGLVTINLTDGSFPANNTWSNPNAIINSLTVWGEALPVTGPADVSVPLVATALLLLTGTLLAGVSVLRRRQQTAD